MYVKFTDSHGGGITYATTGSAGADLRVSSTVVLFPNKVTLCPTGISAIIPSGVYGDLRIRSSVSKYGLMLANGAGVIDSDYTGEIFVPIYNGSSSTQTIEVGSRIAQIVFNDYIKAKFLELDRETFDEKAALHKSKMKSNRNASGFGSTGKM